jgi:CHASE3 domain sensor protein
MNSRLIRVLLVVVAIAVGFTASYFLRNLETDLANRHSSLDTLRDQASALTTTIVSVRAGQFAYVARGQGEKFWISQVETLMPALKQQTADFAAALTLPSAQATFEPASAALENLQTLDARVKEFVQGGNPLLAADLIFSDGLESTTTAISQVSRALDEEIRSRLAGISDVRRRQLAILGGAVGAVLLLMIALAVTGIAVPKPVEPEPQLLPQIDPVRFEAPLPRAKPAVTPKLVRTAQLCRELTAVAETEQLPGLLERVARVLDASGIVVWIADSAGRELRPAVAHGYTDQMLGRLGRIARDANNATASAYRSSEMRTVPGDGATSGAVILPLTTTDGCIGVLCAEMKGGSEKDESSQALAAIFAAQLATLVATPPPPPLKAAAQA